MALVADAAVLADAATAGFSAVAWEWSEKDEASTAAAVAAGVAAGLRPLVALDLTTMSGGDLVSTRPELFSIRAGADLGIVDPRRQADHGTPIARLHSVGAAEWLAMPIASRLARLAAAGVHGFVFTHAEAIGAPFLTAMLAELRRRAPDLLVLAAGDAPAGDVPPLIAAGLDGWIAAGTPAVIAGLARSVAPRLLVAPDAKDLLAAVALADGLSMSAERFRRAPDQAARAIALLGDVVRYPGQRTLLRATPATVLRVAVPDLRQADQALMVAINMSDEPITLPAQLPGAGLSPSEPMLTVPPGEVATAALRRGSRVADPDPRDVAVAAEQPRLVVEQISPAVDGGDFAVKRIVGEAVTVTAAVFADGHEQLAAELLWRPVDTGEWQRVPMMQLPNDGWAASFTPDRLGRHVFAVEGWLDRFGGFQRDFAKKRAAGVDQAVDQAEGRLLVAQAAARTGAGALADHHARLEAAGDSDAGAELLLSPELKTVMRAADDRPHRLRSAPHLLDAERIEARFSSWYELFPRSISDRPERHGTFADVIGRLPAIRDMGFDTLYFPPIHPIGRTNRKGRNNTLTPGPDDPGSPYAIGSADGGHEAIHPELGSFADFAQLVEAARAHGLEIALDFAIQCSPDHPWLKEHPGWFAWRPDGSMKYAENPPKKYQDIVNVDFYGPDAVPDLWLALCDVVLLWVEHGVKVFRVDNPHTKPLPFWEWMIGRVRAQHPDTIFLAEAFTRPNMMYRLGKIGFSQSYTYFTWRDTKAELTDYFVELATTAPAEFYRPHLFVSTPDINPIYLQTSGRPGFRIRAVLAATLSGLFGVYSGFELCEAAPVPGKEEFLDSEKYEIKPRDWQAPGNIIADITLLNRLRRENPALQTHLNTRFLAASNDRVIYYAKPAPDGSEIILVMVSLDPHGPQETGFDVPLWLFDLPDTGDVAVEDLAEGWQFRWYGKAQTIRLDPDQPFKIWRIRP